MASPLENYVADASTVPDVIERECETHGSFNAKHLFGNYYLRCPQCQLVQEAKQAAADDARKREQQEANTKAQLEFNLRNSGLAGRNLRATFENFIATTDKQSEVLETVRKFAKTFTKTSRGGLWLIGSPGTGKTHLGAALTSNSIRERGLAACMHSFSEIQTMLRARWASRKEPIPFWATNDGLETTDQLLEHWGVIPMLVIDEIGVGRGTDSELETLFQIVDRRYQLERATVVLSNLKPAELKVAMGDRVYDRLREGTQLLICDWPSHRGAAK